ncbi:hypothetical protein F53441_9727 [Fusarium austroafricanum]|uniref:Protein NO VEIN C-terminal domain-containing protein n=1 Tax=Fusarium austroafricanum TaxID=2364996 RepID=A0A8H4NT20_9HYPO|nr:hypothetical protein F53441_9727 [Fusarium austroafricanum]
MATLEEAEQIVKEVTSEYGYLDHDMMDDIGRYNSNYRRKIDENWLKMENAASHSIKVLAKNIYGSGARFVFELLQNAEDNRYLKAGANNAAPFISFKIYPKHIVVECNEDGFTKPDLKAICSVGESTKTAAHGYVGAKGIGFKSVFIAANRVHIQSGNFSFEFRHNKTDPGLGMVRPIWVNPTERTPIPLTRTTLYLHDQGDEDEIEHLKTIIAMQFDDLQETCLLFLRKLQQITVAFYDGEGKLQRSKRFRKVAIGEHRVSLETTTIIDGQESTKSQIYHITKQLATGLAQSESRDPATTEEARRILTSAEVVLAFPLTNDYKPHISRQKQELFAFLPLRTSDYKFHIQSDFDTNANRQDIVTTTRRNLNIRDWIGAAFLKAVFQFCEDPTLCYHWPLFLPSQENGFDSFWSGLNAMIKSLLSNLPVVKSRHRNDLRLIRDVLILSSDTRDEAGQPLFDDPIKDPFISSKYPRTATQALQDYGLKTDTVVHFIDQMKADLDKQNSKIRSEETSDEWHAAVARLCSMILANGWYPAEVLRSLPILPLRDDEWGSSLQGPVYFPKTGEIDIPGNLKLKVLRLSTTGNADRNTLFRHLGVSEASFQQVRSSIFSSFSTFYRITTGFTHESLVYLYLTHQSLVHQRRDYSEAYVLLSTGCVHQPQTSAVYLPGADHRFSPKSLLEGQEPAPDFPVYFLRDWHFDYAPDQPSATHPTWKRWLCDYVGQFPFLILGNEDATQSLSAKWDFLSQHFGVGRNESLDFLLKILHYITECDPDTSSVSQTQRVFELYIAIYAKLAVSTDQAAMRSRLRDFFHSSVIVIPDGNELTWTSDGVCLWSAPSDMWSFHSLKSLYMRMSLSEEDMSSIENLFHRTLGIRDAEAEDLVTELGALRDEDFNEGDRILALYTYLHDELSITSEIRISFEESPLIFVREQDRWGWHKTSECLWSSATPIRGKVTLDDSYEELKDFFVGKLGVKSLTMQMVYDELRQSPQRSTDDIKVAILSLNDFLQTDKGFWDPEPIRKAKIFPVVYPNGTVTLSSVAVDFAIGDRDNLRYRFEDRISVLDFDLEDVHRLKPLFAWLKLQDRYLSNCVKESTEVPGEPGSPISSTKRDLRLKAYHICRVAATFRSPRFHHDGTHLYEKLRMMKVLEVDEISSVLKMSQNRKLYQDTISTASEHIDERGGALTIYVPRGRREQEICFGSVLPRKLAAWLMRDPDTNIDGHIESEAVNALTSILASERSFLDEILDDQGIIQLPFEDLDEDSNEVEAEDEYGSDGTLETGALSSNLILTPTHSLGTDGPSVHHGTPNSERRATFTETHHETVEVQSRMSHRARREPGPALYQSPEGSDSSPPEPTHFRPNISSPTEQSLEDVRYLAILDRAITAARRANFPSGGAFDMNDLRDALPDTGNSNGYFSFSGLDVLSRFQSRTQQERDTKIGAAGELYVFELLSKLELPNWGFGNWQSTIRTYVTVHSDYADLAPWPNRETADLVYLDTEGKLTDTLIDANILSPGEWTGKRPRYCIEVKTTTGPCKTPFYMSGNQYRLMESIHHSPDRSKVYMVFRVFFLLDRSRINYCVYLDPKKLQDEGRLLFTGTTWSVTPGPGPAGQVS